MDYRKRKAIELLVYSDYTKTKIAKEVGVSETTLYKWLKDEEFMEAYNRELDFVVEEVRNRFKRDADRVYNKLLTVALAEGTADRDAIAATKFLLEMPLGRAPSSLDVTTNQTVKVDKVKDDDILDLFDEEGD